MDLQLILLSSLLHFCYSQDDTRQDYNEICDEWDIYDCLFPYDIQYTYRFICSQNYECPSNFKCCSHRCFRHKICQPSKTTTVPVETITAATAHPGQCNILLSCGIDLPRSFTERFKCLYDGDCPEHFKCCYIECYHHSVCQPAKNEHLIFKTTTVAHTATATLETSPSVETTTEKVFTTNEVPGELDGGGTSEPDTVTPTLPESPSTESAVTTVYTEFPVTIANTTITDVILTDAITTLEVSTVDTIENPTTIIEDKNISVEFISTTNIEISSTEETSTETILLTTNEEDDTEASGDEETSTFHLLATTTGSKNSISEIITEQLTTEGVTDDRVVSTITNQIISISPTTVSPNANVTSDVGDDEDFIEGSGSGQSTLHIDQLITNTESGFTSVQNSTENHHPENIPTEVYSRELSTAHDVDFSFESSGDGDTTIREDNVTTGKDIVEVTSEVAASKIGSTVDNVTTNQTVESSEKVTQKVHFDDEDLGEGSGDNPSSAR